MMRELLIGCGNRRSRIEGAFDDLTTLDINPDCSPDVLHDLENLPLPFFDNSFDGVHAYEVLEHTGHQGDFKFFFAQFSDFWRILKPGGLLCATCPRLGSGWLWGDPGHTRVISRESLTFLVQPQYDLQVGFTSMTDYRQWYKADFEGVDYGENGDQIAFVLRAVKPSRITPRRQQCLTSQIPK